MPPTPKVPSNNNSQRVRQHMAFPSSTTQGGAKAGGSPTTPTTNTNPVAGGGGSSAHHYSSRIVIVGSENCTSAILGTQIQENQISVAGRLGEWAKASQAFGCSEIQMSERLVNCPTSKRNLRAAAKNHQQQNANNNNNATSANPISTSGNLKDGIASSEFPSNLRSAAESRLDNNTSATNTGEGNTTAAKQQQQSAVAQLIHAKSTTLNQILPGLTLELFEINEADVPTLTHDQLFGPYVLPTNTAAVILVLDCAALFPSPPACSLLVESVESVIQTIERKKKEAAQKKARDAMTTYSPLLSIDEDLTAARDKQEQQQQKSKKNGKRDEDNPENMSVPTLCDVLETYRQRQDSAAEQYILNATERIQALRTALDTWAGNQGQTIPIHVTLHNTEIVAPRLEAWSVTTQWAKISDASRAKVLSKLPKRDPEQEYLQYTAGINTSNPASANSAANASKPAVVTPSMSSCCAPEPFVQPHLTLHNTYPLVSGTVRSIRGVLTTISNRVNGILFFPSLTSVLDQTPIALLSSVVARPQVVPNNNHLQEIVHSFKTRCLFRRVFVVEPRSLIVVAADKPFTKMIAGFQRNPSNEKETVANLLHQSHSPMAKVPGVETSFTQSQSFVQDYLSVVDALKLSTALAPITLERFSDEETTLIRAAFSKDENRDDILMNVAEGGLASWRGSFEMTNGEGVYMYGLAPPVNLLLCCIGDCSETQRTQSLIEFNLHIIQQTVSGLFEETMKRARASGYAA